MPNPRKTTASKTAASKTARKPSRNAANDTAGAFDERIIAELEKQRAHVSSQLATATALAAAINAGYVDLKEQLDTTRQAIAAVEAAKAAAEAELNDKIVQLIEERDDAGQAETAAIAERDKARKASRNFAYQRECARADAHRHEQTVLVLSAQLAEMTEWRRTRERGDEENYCEDMSDGIDWVEDARTFAGARGQ